MGSAGLPTRSSLDPDQINSIPNKRIIATIGFLKNIVIESHVHLQSNGQNVKRQFVFPVVLTNLIRLPSFSTFLSETTSDESMMSYSLCRQ